MQKLKDNKTRILPFDFVLEALHSVGPYTKPMFGCYAVYIENKIIFILREKREPKSDNGVWLATTIEHHDSLKKLFPSMRSITLFGPGVTGWQVLPVDSSDFESSVLKACDLVLARDPRIGKIPKTRLAAGSSKAKNNKSKKLKKNQSTARKK